MKFLRKELHLQSNICCGLPPRSDNLFRINYLTTKINLSWLTLSLTLAWLAAPASPFAPSTLSLKATSTTSIPTPASSAVLAQKFAPAKQSSPANNSNPARSLNFLFRHCFKSCLYVFYNMETAFFHFFHPPYQIKLLHLHR